MNRLLIVVLGVGACAACGCAPGSNPLTDSYGDGSNAGFWVGLWQGMICPIALVISWFNSDVSIYEVHNSGGWYNTGFVLGAGAWGIFRASRGGGGNLEDYDDEAIREEAERRELIENPNDDLDAEDDETVNDLGYDEDDELLDDVEPDDDEPKKK